METRRFFLTAVGALAAVVLHTAPAPLHAQAHTPSALTGQVRSTEEGPMEGVVVSAKKDGSTISISVVTNAEWLMSMPGTDEQKRFLLNCNGCHTLERIMKSTYDADGFLTSSSGWAAIIPAARP